MKRYEHYTDTSQLVLPALDTALLFAVFHLADYSPAGVSLRHAGLASYPSLLFVIFVLSWGILSRQYANLYRLDRLMTYTEKLLYLLRTLLLHATLVAVGVLLLGSELAPPRLLAPYLATIYAGMGLAIAAGRFALAFGFRAYRRHLARPRSRYVIVGLSDSGQELYHMLGGHDASGSEFRGFFVEGPEAVPAHLRALVRGTVADLKRYCRDHGVDELYFALPLDRQALIADLSEFAADNFLAFRIVPDYAGTVGRDVSVYFHDRLPILTIRREPLGLHTNQLLKRGFDIAFSAFVIGTMLVWLLPLLALLIKLDSRGPVFFKQQRPGWRNQLFPCYKLRTMQHGHRQPEHQATKADPRVTRVGRYLRKYNLDELPQFFNVLLGHMSVVGPRPNMVSQLEEYSKQIRTYPMRHAVMPGITGYAQVNGCRGETRAPQAMQRRVEYDLKYLESWSFALDMQIIGQTVRNMLRGEENAY